VNTLHKGGGDGDDDDDDDDTMKGGMENRLNIINYYQLLSAEV
jgi:hypothetical protein